MTPARLPAADAALLDARIDDLWPGYVDVLADLVRIPSTAPDEGAAQEFLATRARAAGMTAELWDTDPEELAAHPAFATADHSRHARPNLTAILSGSGGGDRSIAVSGHIDVVPIEPVSHWTREPWGGTVEGDRLYGRGALDMKGGLVAGLLAIHALATSGLPRRGDVVFESVVEEESTGNGTLAARGHGPRVDAAVIPEITGEHVQIANPGVLWFEVTVTGTPAYVGRAGASVNAIDVAMELIAHLRALPARFNAAFEHPAYDGIDEPLTLNAGTIRGGDWPSNVPLECVVGFRLAFPLDWPVQRAKNAVRACVDEFAAAQRRPGGRAPRVRWHGFQAAGFAIDPGEPIVALLREEAAGVSGAAAPVSPMLGTADARHFAASGIPAVYYGPGGGGMHAPDEWVDLASVRRVARTLARTVAAWVGRP